MISSRRFSAVVLVLAVILGACSSDDLSSGSKSTTIDVGLGSTTEPAGDGQPATPSGDVNCPAVGDALGKIFVNWQVVLGLVNSPASEWASLPIGTLSELSAQLSIVGPAVSGNSAAADAVAFMTGANDIVVRGVGGDAAAQADLAAYLGDDVTVNILKQQDISIAYASLGCG